MVEIGVYLRGCRAFAELASEVGFVRYEDFTNEPDAVLARLCVGLGVVFDPGWRERFRTYAKVTGDEATMAASIGEIRPARRYTLDAATAREFDASEDYREACRLMAYDPEISRRDDA